jgi:hypothetical protein
MSLAPALFCAVLCCAVLYTERPAAVDRSSAGNGQTSQALHLPKYCTTFLSTVPYLAGPDPALFLEKRIRTDNYIDRLSN